MTGRIGAESVAVQLLAAMAIMALHQSSPVVNIRSNSLIRITQIIGTNSASMAGGALLGHMGGAAEAVTVTGSSSLDKPATHAVGPADMALTTGRVTTEASQIKSFFNRSTELAVASFHDQGFFTPELRVQTVCIVFRIDTRQSINRILVTAETFHRIGAGVSNHSLMSFFHADKLEIRSAAMAALTGNGTMSRLQEIIAVVTSDYYFFPSFQLGYFAASAIVLQGRDHLPTALFSKGCHQHFFAGVTIQTGVVAGSFDRAVGGFILTADDQQKH